MPPIVQDPVLQTLSTPNAGVPHRSLQRVLEPFDRAMQDCSRILATAHGRFEHGGRSYSLPRYLYVGRRGGGDMVRVGIFATIHGDEPEGVLGLGRFLQELAARPELGEGYMIFIYPMCNPSGFEDNTRNSRSGRDLNREFWTDSAEPEVRLLEEEIQENAFDGIITLHSDDTSDGLYGFVRGAVLSEHLLQPALLQAGRFLPRNHRETIDGFEARHGIIRSGYPGMLQAGPHRRTPPFEITFETPQKAPLHRQVDALVAALSTILTEYRYLQALGQNI